MHTVRNTSHTPALAHPDVIAGRLPELFNRADPQLSSVDVIFGLTRDELDFFWPQIRTNLWPFYRELRHSVGARAQRRQWQLRFKALDAVPSSVAPWSMARWVAKKT